MPVIASFLIALIAAVGFFGTLFALVILLVEGRRAKAAPRMGVARGEAKGTLNVWVNWDPNQFAIEVYRLRFQHITPQSAIKEGTFTVTFENPLTSPFIQSVQLPQTLMNMIDNPKEKGLLTVDFKTVHETTIQKVITFKNLRKIFASPAKLPNIANRLATAKEDVATVLSLDFEELQARKKRIGDLEAAAKAKAAKAAAKPAPAPAAAAPAPQPAAAAAPKPAPAPTPTPATAAAPSDKPVKSVREMVSQANATPSDKPVGK